MLEQAGCLHPTDLVSLHYPWIQHQLDTFQRVWSNHKMRTAKQKTPNQLWVVRMLTTKDEVATQGMACANIGVNSVLSELSSAFDGSESPEQVEVNDFDILLSNE